MRRMPINKNTRIKDTMLSCVAKQSQDYDAGAGKIISQIVDFAALQTDNCRTKCRKLAVFDNTGFLSVTEFYGRVDRIKNNAG